MNAVISATALPPDAVFARAGDVLTSSQMVARVFGKQHGNVLRDIERLIATNSDLSSSAWFRKSSYVDAKGESRPCYEMTRDALSMLAMGFTGAKAVSWKMLFIRAFNTMEAQLRATVAPLSLDDPRALRAALLRYTEETVLLEEKVAKLEPMAAAWERIADTSGMITLTAFAKSVGVGPRWLVSTYLTTMVGWCFRRHESKRDRTGPLVAYQHVIDKGWMTHKLVEFTRPDGSTGTRSQAYLTPAGAA